MAKDRSGLIEFIERDPEGGEGIRVLFGFRRRRAPAGHRQVFLGGSGDRVAEVAEDDVLYVRAITREERLSLASGLAGDASTVLRRTRQPIDLLWLRPGAAVRVRSVSAGAPRVAERSGSELARFLNGDITESLAQEKHAEFARGALAMWGRQGDAEAAALAIMPATPILTVTLTVTITCTLCIPITIGVTELICPDDLG